MFRQHGMDGVPQLMRHGGHVIGFALVVEQHPGGDIRVDGGAESPAALALAHLAVEMVICEHAFRHLGEARVELAEGLQHLGSGFGILVRFFGFGDRRVDIITAQFFHAEEFCFELEETFEHGGVFAAGL